MADDKPILKIRHKFIDNRFKARGAKNKREKIHLNSIKIATGTKQKV